MVGDAAVHGFSEDLGDEVAFLGGEAFGEFGPLAIGEPLGGAEVASGSPEGLVDLFLDPVGEDVVLETGLGLEVDDHCRVKEDGRGCEVGLFPMSYG